MKAKLLSILLGTIGPLLLHIIDVLVNKNVLNTCVELARSSVEKLMGDTSIDGATKRSKALAQLKEDVKELGLDVGESILNLALELAVAATKSKFSK